MENDRLIVLLEACRDLLLQQDGSAIVLNLLEETVYYDDATWDGCCLLGDIEDELELWK